MQLRGTCYWSLALVSALYAAVCGHPASAQEQGVGDEGGRAWDFSLGAGGYFEPRYSGAEDLRPMFLPVVSGSLRAGRAFAFVDVSNGSGLGLRLGEAIPVSLVIGAKSGKNRDGSLSSALDGLPDIKNYYRIFGNAKVAIPGLGDASLGVVYAPITADGRDGEEKYRGFLFDAGFNRSFLVGRFALATGIGLEAMNADYAKAYYGIRYATAGKEEYDAGAGLKSVFASVSVTRMFSTRIGGSLFGFGEYLVGEAAESPVVDRRFQPTLGLLVFYRF
jgi:MipA family protein